LPDFFLFDSDIAWIGIVSGYEKIFMLSGSNGLGGGRHDPRAGRIRFRAAPDDRRRRRWKRPALAAMLVVGGSERTEQQYAGIFSAAGLRMSRVVPTAHEVSVIEGVCPI
jgi:hypothetical protein